MNFNCFGVFSNSFLFAKALDLWREWLYIYGVADLILKKDRKQRWEGFLGWLA